jgi:titin
MKQQNQTPVSFPSQFKSPALQLYEVAKPKFEPIEKIEYVESKPKVFKPTPVTPAKSAFSNYTENTSQSSNQSKSYYYSSGPQTTTTNYYTSVTGPPIHNAVATEASHVMQMKESTENTHRVVNISNTRRVISLEPTSRLTQELEPFPYSPDQSSYKSSIRVPPPPTPTKFVPGEFRESDYDSELESSRIRPIWTPNQNDSDNLHYRRVRPPSSRSSSVPRSYERVMTPMEFDTSPVVMPTKIKIDSPSMKSPQQYFTSSLYRTAAQHQKQTRDDSYLKSSFIVDHATQQISTINTSFKDKASQFMRDVISDVQQKPILKKPNEIAGGQQSFRNESRVSKYGES